MVCVATHWSYTVQPTDEVRVKSNKQLHSQVKTRRAHESLIFHKSNAAALPGVTHILGKLRIVLGRLVSNT